MYTNNICSDQTIEYDDMISKIKEMIEKGLNKLKSFVKSKINPNLNFYRELDSEFDEIASKLEELGLLEEYKYFIAIEDMILYIVQKNSINNRFGHCNFAVDLLDFFIDLFKTNLEFYNMDDSIDKEFACHRNNYKNKYHEYRRIFYQDIYEPSGNYSEEDLYEILKSLNGDF